MTTATRHTHKEQLLLESTYPYGSLPMIHVELQLLQILFGNPLMGIGGVDNIPELKKKEASLTIMSTAC